MKLEARLEAALTFIRSDVHVDIGSDHARLPIELVKRGLVERCVIVEKNEAPFDLARRHVAKTKLGTRIDVRLGDGFEPVAAHEVQSASMTGLGVRTMIGVLERGGERVPPNLVLQPNDDPAHLRTWARSNGYHLEAELLAEGFWRYPVLSFARGKGEDPAYDGLPPDLAVKWGPHLLRRRDPDLRAVLSSEWRRLAPARRFARPEVLSDLDLVERALAFTSAEG